MEEILRLHETRIAEYGGTLGVRDPAGLDAAVHMPQAGMGDQYFHTDVYEMAAAYLFHLVKGHPFVDGNKRVGAIAADVFLALNGIDLVVDADQYEQIVLRATTSECDKTEIAEFFRRHGRPLGSAE